jgi:hypothetical protein
VRERERERRPPCVAVTCTSLPTSFFSAFFPSPHSSLRLLGGGKGEEEERCQKEKASRPSGPRTNQRLTSGTFDAPHCLFAVVQYGCIL